MFSIILVLSFTSGYWVPTAICAMLPFAFRMVSGRQPLLLYPPPFLGFASLFTVADHITSHDAKHKPNQDHHQ